MCALTNCNYIQYCKRTHRNIIVAFFATYTDNINIYAYKSWHLIYMSTRLADWTGNLETDKREPSDWLWLGNVKWKSENNAQALSFPMLNVEICYTFSLCGYFGAWPGIMDFWLVSFSIVEPEGRSLIWKCQ